MKYVYPKFSEHEFIGFRLSGAGLGNLLFIYSRALIYSIENNCDMIWPTWFSIRPGTWIRNESDKRIYGDLFKNNSKYVSGLKKYWLLLTMRKFHHNSDHSIDNKNGINIYNYHDMKMEFSDLIKYRKTIYDDLYNNLEKKNKIFEFYDYSNTVNVHIRLGDFNRPSDESLEKGLNNISISIDWYIYIIKQLSQISKGKLNFNVFSDGLDNELKEVIALDNVKRVSFGNSITDIFALSRSKLIIASGSSFSLWARFLGQADCITYPRQLKAQVLANTYKNFEIEVGLNEIIPDYSIKLIKEKYCI